MATTEDKQPRRGRPATGQTPLHAIRIPDDLWADIKAAAKGNGETATALIIRGAAREVQRAKRTKATSTIESPDT